VAEDADKSRRYLHLAAANERRAASADGEEFKTVLLRVAAEYRDLALQIEDPKKWRAKQRARRFYSDLRAKIG
jgi:hypothetical protein